MFDEDKTFENEIKKEETKEPNHGGKRPGSGRPLGAVEIYGRNGS